MKMKRYACLFTALLLMIAVWAVPVFAAPEESTSETTTAIDESASQESTSEETQPPPPPTAEQTWPEPPEDYDPLIAEMQPPAGAAEDAGLFSARNIAIAALCAAVGALVLSIIALARTKKKAAPNATGNYGKYF